MPILVDPCGKGKRLSFVFDVMIVIVLFAFLFFGATVFAEPAESQIEEVSRLMHFANE